MTRGEEPQGGWKRRAFGQARGATHGRARRATNSRSNFLSVFLLCLCRGKLLFGVYIRVAPAEQSLASGCVGWWFWSQKLG